MSCCTMIESLHADDIKEELLEWVAPGSFRARTGDRLGGVDVDTPVHRDDVEPGRSGVMELKAAAGVCLYRTTHATSAWNQPTVDRPGLRDRADGMLAEADCMGARGSSGHRYTRFDTRVRGSCDTIIQ